MIALPRLIRSTLGDTRGNVAVAVALSLAPLSLAALGALDVARATAAKLQLQDALDSATLATAKTTVSDSTQLQQTGDRIFRQNLALDPSVRLTADSFTFGAGGTVVGDATAAVKPLIIGFVTGGDLMVGAHTEVKRAGYELEIALVLDNTLSMQGQKIANLKTAAANFIDSMAQAAAQSGDPNAVKISLVPFSQTVRVGASYKTASWIDQGGVSPINNQIFVDDNGVPQWANRFTLLSDMNQTWAGCVESRAAPYDIQDTAPDSAATVFTPYFAPDEPDGGGPNYNNSYINDKNPHTTQRGKQGDIGKYKGASVSPFSTKGPNKGCDMQPIQRLTTDWPSLKSAISAMKPTGTTNIPMGLVWGWHTLSPKAPFADGVAYNTPKHKKIVILMTDGENTLLNNGKPPNDNVTDYSGVGYLWQGRVLQASGAPLTPHNTKAERTAALDDRLEKLCANMKAGDVDIEIYTMRVEVKGGASTVLQDCASGADHYYDVQNAADLNSVFQQIANGIASLHLSK